MVVENAFGILKTRFRRIFHFTEQLHLNIIANIIVSACVLHNICITQNDVLIDPDMNEQNTQENVGNNDNLDGANRRQLLINELIENNVL